MPPSTHLTVQRLPYHGPGFGSTLRPSVLGLPR